MAWMRRNLRGNPVFVRVGDDGQPAADSRGRVEVVYKMEPGAKVYRASVRNLEPTGDPADDRPFEPDVDPTVKKKDAGDGRPVPPDAIIVYTDGACTGNPGPMGLGAVIVDGDERDEVSEYLGVGTNNIAELTAIERALETIPPAKRQRTVVIHSDSSYSIGVLGKNWKAKANTELVARIRKLMTAFADVRFVKVKGHAGIPENERCDLLATSAISSR